MSNETRENKEIHQNQQLNAQNKKLSQMTDAEFAAEFDSLTPEQAKKALEKLQQNAQNGEQ